jgi:hypothetical protein
MGTPMALNTTELRLVALIVAVGAYHRRCSDLKDELVAVKDQIIALQKLHVEMQHHALLDLLDHQRTRACQGL